MIYIDELKNMKLYKRQFLLPVNSKDKKHGNSVMLLTPNMESSIKTMNHPLIDPRYYNSYYVEKDVSYLISNESLIKNTPNEYIHESVNEPITEMIGIKFGTHKQLIFNGYNYDVEEAKKEISIDKIENINNMGCFNVSVNYPVSVTVYPKLPNEIPKSTAGSINISSYRSFSDYKEYELYCIRQIVEMLARTINPDVNDNFAYCLGLVVSGYFDIIEKDIYGEPLYNWCNGIKELMYGSDEGPLKVRKCIKKNDFSKILKLSIKDLNAEIKNIFTESEKMDDLTRIKRNITRKLNNGSKNAAKSIADNIENAYDIKAPQIEAPIPVPGAVSQTPLTNSQNKEKKEENAETESYNFSYDCDIPKEEGFNDLVMRLNESVTFFNEADESAKNVQLKKLLYRDRLKANKEVFLIYDQIKEKVPYITNTYIRYSRYKKLNLFVDLYFYNKLFFDMNTFKFDKGIDLYFELLKRMINDKSLVKEGYENNTIIIPIRDWDLNTETKMWMYQESINPISMIYRLIQKNLEELQDAFKDKTFVFLADKGYFKIQFSKFQRTDTPKFLTFIKTLRSDNPEIEEDNDLKIDSKKAIVDTIVGKIEDNNDIKMYALTGKVDPSPIDKKDIVSSSDNVKSKKSSNSGSESTKSKETIDQQNVDTQIKRNKADKEAIVDKISKVADTATDVDDAINQLDQDEEFKKLLLQLQDDNPEVKINAARATRIRELDNSLMTKEIRGTTVKDMLEKREKYDTEKLKETSLPIDSINPEWNKLTYINMAKQYDPNADIVAVLKDLSTKTYPISIRNIEVTDTSNSEDYIYTYKVECESHTGKRFSLKFDVPILKNNLYMKLRGNKKTIATQQYLMPIVKTDIDTVQIVANYKKIFVRTFGTTTGKSNVITDRIIKTLNKGTYKGIEVITGDNSRISVRYELPIDYSDLASIYSKIETTNVIFCFNQYALREEFKDKIDDSRGLPVGYLRTDKSIVYYNEEDQKKLYNGKGMMTFSAFLRDFLINESKEFEEAFDKTTESVRYTYSKASILNSQIPVAVLVGYSVGLTKMMELANIPYEIVEKRPPKSRTNEYDVIRFNDAFIKYDLSYNSSLLMNGLKECDTVNYSITEINNKTMYLDFLDQFGGRIKADGIDNFYDCMIDPITKSTLQHYHLPETYIELLLYANYLLSDNKYDKHGYTGSKRLRRNELIAAYACNVILTAYGQYAIQLKHGRDAIMTMKQSAIIDAILADPTSGDLSIINPLNEKEAYDAVSPKGLSGMNSDRAYSLDKRSYDESMINVLGMSTGFAGNVGITRQSTINASVDGVRGYIKPSKTEDMNSVNSLCMTEAISVYSSTRDDPFRTAMTFVQTSKHTVRSDKYTPVLVTTGADQALPYMISDDFAFKAKQPGTVQEIGDDYMILKYKDGSYDYVDMKDKAEKNSSTGFFVSLKLDTDLTVGKSFKQGEIVAYDRKSFNNSVGISNNLAYSFATLVKCALMSTDEGFEDSAIVDSDLAEALTTEVIKEKSVTIPKNTNIYNLVSIGQEIQEGDTLMVMQSPYDDVDASILLKNLAGSEDEISELGRVPIKSKVTGVVHDIKVYRTVELDEMSESLRKICSQYDSKIKKKKSVLNKYHIEDNTILDADYTLSATGKLKNADDSVVIVFYLKYRDRFGIGDKMIYYNANKGVCKDIIPKGLEPYSMDRPDEKLHTLVSIASINGRMVTSIPNMGVQHRLLIEESRKIKDMAGIKYNVNLLEEDNK